MNAIIKEEEKQEDRTNVMEKNSCSPSKVTSRRRIVYKESESSWRVHRFDIHSGEPLCRVEVLRMRGSLLLWVGGGGRGAQLGAVALGVPAGRAAGAGAGAGLATALLQAEGDGTALARRLAAFLHRPVYVCFGCTFDRYSLQIVEKGLITEIKNRPDCF